MIPVVALVACSFAADPSLRDRVAIPTFEQFRLQEKAFADVIEKSNRTMLRSCQSSVKAINRMIDVYKKRGAEQHANTIAELENKVKSLEKEIKELKRKLPE